MQTKPPNLDQRMLHTPIGDLPLNEYCLRAAGREWRLLHVQTIMTHWEEINFLNEFKNRLPFGVNLWAASIALAHDVATRADVFRGKRILELGAGTGLPGIVAASQGAQVIQTDRNELAMSLAKLNAELNDVKTVEQRIVDWTDWHDARQYDWIIGADIIYWEGTHPYLRRIFESNLGSTGRILLSDPFREESLRLLDALETDGWTITVTKWNAGEELPMQPMGLFELSPPLNL